MNMSLRLSNMRRCLVLLIGLSTLLVSCEKGADAVLQGQPIYLSVSIPYVTTTKVPFEGSAPTTTNPLNVDVWASTTPNEYEHKGWDGSVSYNNKVAIHTNGHFQSGEPQLLSQAIYPPPRTTNNGTTTADPVYFVSMYPVGWTNTSDTPTVANYTFSGCQDLMFAPQVSGAYDLKEQNQVVNDSPVLRFEHLLTLITVKVGTVMEEGERIEDLKSAWGPITDLRIQSYNRSGDYLESSNKVTVDLSKGTAFNYDNDVTFERIQGESMGFFKLGSDDSFPGSGGYELTERTDSVAYVMCAPVVAKADAHEYVLRIVTQNRGVQTLELDIRKTASSEEGTGTTRGNHFSVTLNFKKGRAIATIVNILDWENGGYGTGDIVD